MLILSAKGPLTLVVLIGLIEGCACFQPVRWTTKRQPASVSATLAQFPPRNPRSAGAIPTVQQQVRSPSRVKVRKTVERDLGPVASFLSTATSSSATKQSWPQGFQARIDRLFAKSDIEKLLRGRLQAIEQGEISWRRALQQLQASSVLVQCDAQIRLRHWWSSSDAFRQSVQQAAAATAEPSVWKDHYHVTPDDPSWLQHVQLTAASESSSASLTVPIGFCEVAMLRRSDGTTFPAILNLAVAPKHRRQGVARRLVTVAERYVKRHWVTSSPEGQTKPVTEVGLYVDESNTAALALYTSLGFSVASSSGVGDATAHAEKPFLFMTKALAKSNKRVTKTQGVLSLQ